ncbi:SpaA isopeptide-forming pilin-related protein [Enterococcus gilvus]|uniref:SpaA isopeptide-forming pilin-related protein n=1 Tax=Enterococcus gilvus TaxID=160453 RepID=UPI003D6BD4A5
MRKQWTLKQVGVIILPLMVLIGILVVVIPRGDRLKASNEQSFVSITAEEKAVPETGYETKEETAELTLTTEETTVVKIPIHASYQVVPLNETGNDVSLPEMSQEEFTKNDTLKSWESQLTAATKETDASEGAEETTQASDIPQVPLQPYLQVDTGNETKALYLKLEAHQGQRIRVTRTTEEGIKLDIQEAFTPEKKQPLLTFTKKEQPAAPVTEIPETPTEGTPEETEASPQEEGETGKTEASPQKEGEDEAATASSAELTQGESSVKDTLPEPRATSKDAPFEVSMDVGKETGVAPFDTKSGDGYDSGKDNDLVRTFDAVQYTINYGIPVSSEYESLEIRLDTVLPNAWRKDASGRLRQTAEITNGTVTTEANGTKTSKHSVATTLKGTGQGWFTENIDTYGGVNGDLIQPKFALTIVRAKKVDGTTVTVNQVVDSSVIPELATGGEATITAKPYVDLKLVSTPSAIASFEGATGSKDKPNTMIKNVAAYAQLKPLPGRTGAAKDSIKGSTYPVGGIEYSLDQKMVYHGNGTNKNLTIGTDTDPMEVIMYDGLNGWTSNNPKYTSEYASYASTYKPMLRQGLQAPVGYTKKTYPPTQTYSTAIGIYDTGLPKAENVTSSNTIKITNTDYVPASVGKNKWLLSGGQMPSNAEPFSVIAMQVLFPYEYLEKQTGTGATSVSMDYTLSVSKVKYEGVEQNTSSSLLVSWNKEWPGGMKNYSAFLDMNQIGLSTAPSSVVNYSSDGDGSITQGSKIWGSVYTSSVDYRSKKMIQYGRWNTNSFQYDASRSLTFSDSTGGGSKISEQYYGVGSNSPNITYLTQSQIDNDYTWYPDVATAQAKGKISAIKTVYTIDSPSGSVLPRRYVPLIANGQVGIQDASGNPNGLFTNAFVYDSNDNQIRYYPDTSKDFNYQPPTYTDDGVIKTGMTPKQGWTDSLYIRSMTIRPTIRANKTAYIPSEPIQWTVDGNINSGADSNHKVQFKVTIPKEVQYTNGTAVDYQGNPLPDPSGMEQNSDGSWTLTWVLDYPPGSTYNPKVTFDTSIIPSQLSFVLNSATLQASVVSDIWLEKDETIRDSSEKEQRTAGTSVVVTNSGTITVDKVVDKPYIEAGNQVDPANSSETHPTDFTYTVSFKNHSTVPMNDIRVLDVLPFAGDNRGTNYKGTYSVVDVAQVSGSTTGTKRYTNNALASDRDPNSISLNSGWYTIGSDPSVAKNAKAIMFTYDKLAPGETLSFKITLRPDKQQAGDIYVNSPSLNSSLNQFVQGVNRGVRVVGRDLSGVAWYDDSLDGLIGNKPSTSIPEDYAKDIPVKLYRPSKVNTSYKEKLVTESLTGEKFVDASGDSLIKTDANGKYTFKNLPEGDYVAEFMVAGMVTRKEVKVTKQLVGNDAKLNSKASPTDYKTPDYSVPVVNDLASIYGTGDSIYHVTDVNIGLIRPATVRLFKYIEGTAVDTNKDGKLSDTEKAGGTPLSGANFDIYTKDQEEKVASATTNDDGVILFDKLFPGDYVLVETKAPSGYEKLKDPIKITVSQGDQTIPLYVSNNEKTALPFTGGSNPFLLFLILATSITLIGFLVLMVYYRPRKMKGKR